MEKEYYHSELFSTNAIEVSKYFHKNLPKMLVVSLALRSRAYKTIEDVYNKNPELYYGLYKENADFIEQDKNLFIYPVEIDKKIRQLIGIVTHSLRDNQDVSDFDNILNKGFHDVKRFVLRENLSVSFDEYFISKHPTAGEIDMQQGFCEAVAAVHFGNVYGKKVGISQKFIEVIIKVMEPLNDYDSVLPNIDVPQNQEVLKDYCRFFNLMMPKRKESYTIMGYLSLNTNKKVEQSSSFFETGLRLSSVADFYDTVYIDSPSLNARLKITGEEIQVCMLSAIHSSQEANDEKQVSMDSLLLFITYLHTLSMSKYYNNTKIMANVNAQEDYLHLSSVLQKEFSKKQRKLEKEKELMTNKSQQLIEENKKLQETVSELTRTLKQKEQKEQKTASYEQEIFGLREFLYRAQETIEPLSKKTQEENQEIIQKYTVTIFGGHPNFVNKLSEYLPDSRFISPDDTNKSLSFVKNLKTVFVFSDYFNHSMYYKLMKSLSNETKVIYLPKTVNIQQTLEFIASELEK